MAVFDLRKTLTEFKELSARELEKELRRHGFSNWKVDPDPDPTNAVYTIRNDNGYEIVVDLPRRTDIGRTASFVFYDAARRLGYAPSDIYLYGDILMEEYQETAERLRDLERQMQEEG